MAVYAFRGRRSGLIKLIWHDGIGLCILTNGSSAASSPGPRPAQPAGSRCRRRNWPRCSITHVDAPPRDAERF